MNYTVAGYCLRQPEPADLELLYSYKNDPEIAGMLGGFSRGYAMTDLREWLEFHRQRKDEVLWAIVAPDTGRCAGHVGLYQIDYRIRMAEFAILLGDRSAWGKGLGKACTVFAVKYGFQELNLNRVHLSVLATNGRAIQLYRSVGFREEGVLRQAQFKNGRYIDVLLMSILREEYESYALA